MRAPSTSKGTSPEARPQETSFALKDVPGKLEKLLLVGHEPDLSELISFLLIGEKSLKIELKKAGFCKPSIDQLKFKKCAVLDYLFTPKQIKS